MGANGDYDVDLDKVYYGRHPAGLYIPRFRNVGDDKRDYLRGFGYQGSGTRENWKREVAEFSIGGDYKDALTEPGSWTIGMGGFGEMLPDETNKVTLDKTKKDKWGLNVLNIDCELKDNEIKMRKDILEDAKEMLERAGAKNVQGYEGDGTPGRGIHEMGTARMGKDPKTSVLNKWNQMHDAKNVFITDGSAMASSACQNPSLTYMALTARATDFAVSELKKGNL